MDALGRTDPGVIFVRSGDRPPAGLVSPADPAAWDRQVVGARWFDLMSASVDFADVTGDGRGDVIPTARQEDLFVSDGGVVHVVPAPLKL